MNHKLNPAQHLTDSEFSDLLLGSIPASVSAHLESCPQCAEEARSVSGAILSFERESRAWAERRAAALPALVAPGSRGSSWLGMPGFGVAWQAAAALTLVCAGAGIGYQVQHRAETPVAVASVSSGESSAREVSLSTLKADNDLLSAIDGELQAEATPPPSVYGIDLSQPSPQSRRIKRITN